MKIQKKADVIARNKDEETVAFKSRLSFLPLIDSWKKKIDEGKPGISSYYKDLLTKISLSPELLKPIDDISILKKHQSSLNLMMSTIFPVTLSEREDIFAVAVPFTYQIVYSSELFQHSFIQEKSGHINIEHPQTFKNIIKEKLCGAYQLILNKYYDTNIHGTSKSVHSYKHPVSGLEKFFELELDTRFVDVKTKKTLPELPKALSLHCANDIMDSEDLQHLLPIDFFEFEGMMIVRVNDVTEHEIINEIKNKLLTINAFTETSTFTNLEAQMQNLIGLSGLKIGITPFFKIEQQFVFSGLLKTVSHLFNDPSSFQEKNKLYMQLDQFFSKGNSMLAIPEIKESSLKEYPFLVNLYSKGIKSMIICPLINEKELVGTLEIISETPGQLNADLLGKILPAIPLFTLSLEKSAKNLEARIDAVMKEQFTAIQKSVEWRFTEAALNYISACQDNEDAKIENIVFENVYPLYGAIDIRNSSGERNQAIQQDLKDQLEAVLIIINKAMNELNSPLLNKIKLQTEDYIKAISDNMHSDDEFEIHSFFKKEVKELFYNLRHRLPSIQPDINEYFSIIDSDTKTWSLHRKEFEESLTFVNNTISRFIDREQVKAQQIFPHYFERFVTDGIDFNIYIGGSIAPQRNFTIPDLRQLKLWQLTTMARAAILGKKLEKNSSVPLQTTQLILAHNQPISISFRTAERKFDVDGAYNIRYEIIKKRIDKVHINTGERLTQPGMLAIVYTQPDEATEYLEFIESLKKEGLFDKEVQHFELEELQGVSGLKALRIAVNLDETASPNKNENKKDHSRAIKKVK